MRNAVGRRSQFWWSQVAFIEYAQSPFGFTSQQLFVGEEELILRDGCCDGFVYTFQRG